MRPLQRLVTSLTGRFDREFGAFSDLGQLIDLLTHILGRFSYRAGAYDLILAFILSSFYTNPCLIWTHWTVV